MSQKGRIQLTLDCDIIGAAKDKYPSISRRVNELLSMDMYGSDEKDKLVNRLHELKLEEKSITKRICELEKKEVQVRENGVAIQETMEWITSIYSRNGVVGLNKVKEECKRKHVSFDEVVQILDSEGIAYVKYA